jgi:uncharacterized membrane protein YcaP (DUF421 family)
MHDLVHLGIPLWDKVVRTLAVYFGLLLLLRLAGKRQLAQLNTFDLVVLLLLSNVVQNAIIGNDNSLFGGLFAAAVLLVGNFGLVLLTYRRRRLKWLLQGSSSVLYQNGRVDEHELRHELMTREELVAALRHQGLELDDVRKVALEPEGTFNATPKERPDIHDVMAALQRIEQRLGEP